MKVSSVWVEHEAQLLVFSESPVLTCFPSLVLGSPLHPLHPKDPPPMTCGKNRESCLGVMEEGATAPASADGPLEKSPQRSWRQIHQLHGQQWPKHREGAVFAWLACK